MQTERVLTTDEIEEMNSIRWWHRIPIGKTPEGTTVYTPGEVWHGADGEDYATARFGLPRSMTGLRVADVGGWDGYFAFEAERRGAANVTIFDVDPQRGGNWGGTRGFEFARQVLDSKVDFVGEGIYEVTPELYGEFDVVFFFGVLYHLKEPLTALEHLYRMVAPGGYSLIETARAQRGWLNETVSAFAFMPGFDGDPTNYFYPTPAGLDAALRMAQFRTVLSIYDDGIRYTAFASR